MHNMIACQNWARGELILEMQTADPLVPARADLFNQMRAISDPNSQLEVLAYDLTASELNAFAEFQEQRQNNSASFGPIGGTKSVLSGGSAFFEDNLIHSRSEQSAAVQILTVNPSS